MILADWSNVLDNLSYQLPVLVSVLVCAVIVGVRSGQAGAGAKWALIGFILLLVLGVAGPFINEEALDYARQHDYARDTTVHTVALTLAVLRGVCYFLLLAGVLAGRAVSPSGYPSQNYPPQNYPPQNYPPQNYPPQNYPPQNYPQPPPGQYRQ